MERHPQNRDQEPSTPLERRRDSLQDYLETARKPKLKKLDEYFVIAEQYYQQEARKSGEDHEEAYRRAQFFQEIQHGSWQDKQEYSLSRQKQALISAERCEKEGDNIDKILAKERYRAAENWGKIAHLGEQQIPGKYRREKK